MTTTDPSQILLALISPVTAVALIVFVQNWQARRASKPKASADANATNLEAQGKTVDRLTNENARLSSRLEAAEKKIDDLIARDDRRELQLRDAESKIDELETREEAREVLNRKHREWDELAVSLIRTVIPPIHLDPPPPLDVKDKPEKP